MDIFKTILTAAVVALVVAVGVSLVGDKNQPAEVLGGSRFPSGLSADSTSPSSGELRGTTLTVTNTSTFGGDLTVTTSNSATTSVTTGCVETTATSTATPVKIVLGKLDSTATTTFYGNTSKGAVYWTYGTCP